MPTHESTQGHATGLLRSPIQRLIVALIIFGISATSSAVESFPAATPESQGLSSQSLEQFVKLVQGFVDNGEIVGGELLVIKNRRTVLHEAVGQSDREKNTRLELDTIYCIRSMTKPLVGAAVQVLLDEGRLSLDDRVAKYLPSFDNEKSRKITVRQLLTHTGGLPLSSLLGTNFNELSSLRDVADKSGMQGPTIEPGSGFQYSDDGADTLGAIVSAIAGEPTEAFIAKRILEPLGMRDTIPLVRMAGDKIDRFTPAYMGSRGNWLRFSSPQDAPLFRYFLASQGMYSTTKDYARFLAMYLDRGRVGNERVLSEAAVERTLEPSIATRTPIGFPTLTAHYGQMMLGYLDANRKLIAFGHSGSDGTWAWAWPEHDLMVLYFTQSRGNLTGLELEGAIDRLLLGGAGPAPLSKSVTTEFAAPYLGVYWLEARQRPMIVVRDEDRLAVEIPWQGFVELKRTEDENVWAFALAPNASVKFHREGAAPAAALELRRGTPVTLRRFQPESGLPSLDDLLKRRPDSKRAEKLAALGVLRMTGRVELTTSQAPASFELLASGNDHSRLKFNLGGAASEQIVSGDRAWMQPLASMPFQEMSASMAHSIRLAGWLLSSGDWHKEFAQARVLKRVELDGESVYIVHAVPKEGRHRLVYVNEETGLPHGYDEIYELPGVGMIGSEVRFANYRDVNGVQIPSKASVKYPTPLLGTQTYHIDKIETNLRLDDDPFTVK